MFKKSRRKIVAAIMSVLVSLWIATLGIIYTSSYIEMSERNHSMVKTHAQMYNLDRFSNGESGFRPRPEGNRPGFADTPMFQLSTFYTVALSYDGEVLEIKNDRPTVHQNSELQSLAKDIVASNNASGTKNNLVYYAMDKDGYILVAFMDNTVINESITTLFRYTLIFGALAIIAFFFLAVFLAKKIVDPLEEGYKKQKQFISDAGHELKTPVSVVSANAELLSREIGENKWLQNIRYENERISTLVTQLLNLARTENTTPQMEVVNFSRLVIGESLPFESVAYEKNIGLCCKVDPEIFVMGSSVQLKQIVSILLDNAIEHSEIGGEVKISLKKERGQACLSVINSGAEIPKEQRERLFERFYRADSSRADSGHYGLGLAIAKAISESHKGKIEVNCYDGLVEFKLKMPIL